MADFKVDMPVLIELLKSRMWSEDIIFQISSSCDLEQVSKAIDTNDILRIQ